MECMDRAEQSMEMMMYDERMSVKNENDDLVDYLKVEETKPKKRGTITHYFCKELSLKDMDSKNGGMEMGR